jgi:hypothetical protein
MGDHPQLPRQSNSGELQIVRPYRITLALKFRAESTEMPGGAIGYEKRTGTLAGKYPSRTVTIQLVCLSHNRSSRK